MQEHLKRITVPLADGSRRELVIPEETDYGRMERYAREQARSVREELGARLDAHDVRLGELALTEEGLSLLRWELTGKPSLISRLVAIGYPTDEAAGLVSGFGRRDAESKVALREELSTLGYTHVEIEECLEDVPDIRQEDIDYAREILAAWNPEATALNKTWHGDRRLVVFPKIDTSNVKSFNAAWGGCPNLRYFPLLDTSRVTYMAAPFLGEGGSANSARLRRVPTFDYSSLTSCNGVMCSFLPELEIIPPVVFPKSTTLMNVFANDVSLKVVPPVEYTDKVTYFGGMFMGCESLSYLPITDFGERVTNLGSMYQDIGTRLPEPLDFAGVTLRGGSATVRLAGLFQQTKITALPKLEFNNVSDLSYLFAWSEKTPKVIPDFSVWDKVTTFEWFLGAFDNLSAERIEGLDFSSVKSADFFIITQWSPYYFPNLRYIRILNLGKGSCATYDFTHARYWGEDTPEHPDARKSLVDTLLTDSYDRAAAGMSPITVKLHSLTKNRLTAEERAAITAKGITLA